MPAAPEAPVVPAAPGPLVPATPDTVEPALPDPVEPTDPPVHAQRTAAQTARELRVTDTMDRMCVPPGERRREFSRV
jgi:hypothetical protein